MKVLKRWPAIFRNAALAGLVLSRNKTEFISRRLSAQLQFKHSAELLPHDPRLSKLQHVRRGTGSATPDVGPRSRRKCYNLSSCDIIGFDLALERQSNHVDKVVTSDLR